MASAKSSGSSAELLTTSRTASSSASPRMSVGIASMPKEPSWKRSVE